MFYEKQLRCILNFIMDNHIVVGCRDKNGLCYDYLLKLHQFEEFTVYNTNFDLEDIESVTFRYNDNPVIKLKP